MIITTAIITDLTSNESARSEFTYYSIYELTKLHAYKLTDTIIKIVYFKLVVENFFQNYSLGPKNKKFSRKPPPNGGSIFMIFFGGQQTSPKATAERNACTEFEKNQPIMVVQHSLLQQ